MLNKLDQREILELISKKSKENVETLISLENDLIRMRGHVFQMPQPGTPVVASLSGGCDSVIAMGILLKEYRLEVYPFFIDRGQRSLKYEHKSAKYFTKLYQDRYPGQCKDLMEIKLQNPAQEIKHLLNKKLIEGTGYPMRNSIIMEYGVQYAFGMKSHGKHIRDLFCSFVSCDGDYGAQTTLTALRSLMHHVCVDMGDASWQITSLPIEKEIGYYLDKDDLLKWADINNIPVEKTRSCFFDKEDHCGYCYACKHRKESFEISGIKDKTKYIDKRTFGELKDSEDVL